MLLSTISKLVRRPLAGLAVLFALTTTHSAFTWAQAPTDLVGGQFTPNCGNATAAPIFDSALLGSGVYGVNNLIAISDPDIVLIGNQWWMIFAGGPAFPRALGPMAAYLPPGASLATTTTYPADPNGWHIVGAQANGQGTAYPLSSTASSWDAVAAETPSADIGSDGVPTVYYSGHNTGQTNFEIGVMTDFSNGLATGHSNPVMVAEEPWEFSSGLGALLEQSVRWMPQLNKYVMYYTAGAWWASPPDNTIAYADSTDGINWVNRQPLNSPVSYYNQDFLYNPSRNRYEMVISNDPTGAGGANPRNLVWRDAATPATSWSGWGNETTLLQYNAPNGAGWYNSGALSPAVKYGNLPGEENRMFVFFHSYTQSGDMVFGRFYCDAVNANGFTLNVASPTINLLANNGTTDALTVVDAKSFNGSVNFTTGALPAGINVAFSPTSTSSSTQFVVFVQPGTAPGSYPINITGTSGGSYASVTVTVNVGLTQTIAFPAISPQQAGTPLALSATASSGLPVTFASTTPTVCTVAGTTASFAGAGTCTITASQAGNGTYSAAAPVAQSFTVNASALQPQTIAFNAIPAQTVGTTLTVSATASSGLPVTFSVVPNGNCSVSGNVVSFLNAGNCGVLANQAGNSSYSAAPQVGQIVVVNNPTPQTISFAAIAAQRVGTPLGLSATASSGLAVTFASSTPGVCAVAGGVASFSNAGTCTIIASQAGNGTYAAATSVAQSFTVNAALQSQTITFNAIPTQTVGTTLTVSATASSGLAVTFSVVPNGNCSVSGNVISFLNAGNCGVLANQAGNNVYSAAPQVGQIVVVNNPTPQTISFGAISTQKVGTPLGLSATASSGLAVTFASSTQSVCTVAGSTASFSAAGICTIIATQAGNGAYAAAAPVSQSFTVNLVPQAQTITFNAIPAQVTGATLTLNATASSGLPVTYACTTTKCSISGNVVTFLKAGSCSIVASQAGNNAWLAAPSVTQTVTVNKP